MNRLLPIAGALKETRTFFFDNFHLLNKLIG